MTKHHDLLTTDPTGLYDEMQRPFIPARLHLDAARRHIMARPSLVETADKLDATQQLVDELNERLAAATAENERLKAINRETWAEFALVGELLGVPDWTPYHAREVVKAARAVMAENDRQAARVAELETALRPFATTWRINLQECKTEYIKMTFAVDWFKAAADALGEGGRE